MSQYWGSRSIAAVASNGVVTQLFPTTLVRAGGAGTDLVSTSTYPPSGGGLVRRPAAGRTEKVLITPDGINGGVVEFWDVAGTDRGASNNVNDSDTMTDAYVTANGRLIEKLRITGTSPQSSEMSSYIHHVEFSQGLAIRFISGAGTIDVAPFVEAGFMKSYVAG